MRILVTGGAGFIGRHVCAALVARGDEVTVYDAMEPQAQPHMPESCTTRTFPTGRVTLADLNGSDAIIHLGALVGVGQSQYDIERYVRMNTLDTAQFLERLAQATTPRRLIVASSMSVYGEGAYAIPERGFVMRYPTVRTKAQMGERAESGDWGFSDGRYDFQHIPTPETKPLLPASVYAITKRDQEELCLTFGAAHDLPTMALRFGNVYGPGQALGNPYTGVIAIFASRAQHGLAPIVYEDGEQLRDFTHVEDIVQGVLLALDSDVRDRAINLSAGKAVSVGEVAEVVAHCYRAPKPVYPGIGRAGDIRHCYLDITAARRLLGFEPQVFLWTGLAELLRTLEADTPADSEYAEQELRKNGLV